MLYIIELESMVKVGITGNIDKRIPYIESCMGEKAHRFFSVMIPDVQPDIGKTIYNYCMTGSHEERRYEKIIHHRLKKFLSRAECYKCSFNYVLDVVIKTLNDGELQLPYNRHYFDNTFIADHIKNN